MIKFKFKTFLNKLYETKIWLDESPTPSGIEEEVRLLSQNTEFLEIGTYGDNWFPLELEFSISVLLKDIMIESNYRYILIKNKKENTEIKVNYNTGEYGILYDIVTINIENIKIKKILIDTDNDYEYTEASNIIIPFKDIIEFEGKLTVSDENSNRYEFNIEDKFSNLDTIENIINYYLI